MSQDVITQVSNGPTGQEQSMLGAAEDDYNTEIHMNLRGQMFTITRDDLMALPESVLLCLFPNGVFVDKDGTAITNLTEDDVVYVNFSPSCFQYICGVFDHAVRDLQLAERQQLVPTRQIYDVNDPSILNERPSIIVLREDLDYYCIPPVRGLSVAQMHQIKLRMGEKLVDNKKLFDGLGYRPGHSLKPAEQHLMDMLCASGFAVDDDWGHRSLEPGKADVFSLTLVRLSTYKTVSGTPSGSTSPALKPVTSGSSLSSEKRHSRFSTLARAVSRASSRKREKPNPNAAKLLLFWRKPARKCWWSDVVEELDLTSLGLKDSAGKPIGVVKIKVHIRRVWTLELSVIGVQ